MSSGNADINTAINAAIGTANGRSLVDSDEADAAAAHLRQVDTILRPIVDAVGPLRLTGERDYFYSLASAIVGQQISVRAAAAIRQRVEGLMPGGVGLTAAGLLAQTAEQLRGAGLSRSKAAYVLDLAQRVHNGAVDLTRISSLSDEEIIAELIQVKGIGRWTVEMFLIFSLGRPDVLPVDDLGFRTAVKRAYGFDGLPTPAEVRLIAAPWQPYRTAGTWYLWRSLRVEPMRPAGMPEPAPAQTPAVTPGE